MIDLTKLKQEKPITELLEFSIINMDKPAGCTSFDVDFKIKKMLGLRKTSHFGTLDPMVTGVLPVALNRACKLLDYFMHKDKVYVGEMKIHKQIEKEILEKEMKKFLGIIKQTPPVKSRVKRVERERTVNKFEITNFDKEKMIVEFLADVQAGTYIRKLCSDLGEKLGIGAHMIKLRRIRAGLFDDKDLVDMDKFENAVNLWKQDDDETELRKILIPAEIISQLYPVVQITNDKLIKELLTGKPIHNGDVEKISDFKEEVFLVFNKNVFIGVYRKINEENIIAKPNFVKN